MKEKMSKFELVMLIIICAVYVGVILLGALGLSGALGGALAPLFADVSEFSEINELYTELYGAGLLAMSATVFIVLGTMLPFSKKIWRILLVLVGIAGAIALSYLYLVKARDLTMTGIYEGRNGTIYRILYHAAPFIGLVGICIVAIMPMLASRARGKLGAVARVLGNPISLLIAVLAFTIPLFIISVALVAIVVGLLFLAVWFGVQAIIGGAAAAATDSSVDYSGGSSGSSRSSVNLRGGEPANDTVFTVEGYTYCEFVQLKGYVHFPNDATYYPIYRELHGNAPDLTSLDGGNTFVAIPDDPHIVRHI